MGSASHGSGIVGDPAQAVVLGSWCLRGCSFSGCVSSQVCLGAGHLPSSDLGSPNALPQKETLLALNPESVAVGGRDSRVRLLVHEAQARPWLLSHPDFQGLRCCLDNPVWWGWEGQCSCCEHVALGCPAPGSREQVAACGQHTLVFLSSHA